MSALAFTLLIRLPDGCAEPEHPWQTWRQAAAAHGGPGAVIAGKRYPGKRVYFAPQVERVLFPERTPTGGSGRWVRQPLTTSIELSDGAGASFALAVELLEIVRAELYPHVTFGLAHLSVRDVDDPEAMVRCAELLAKRYRWKSDDAPYIFVRRGNARTELRGHEPLRTIAEQLFGSAHANTLHRAHLFVAARLPESVSEADEPMWRRALGRGQAPEKAIEALSADQDRDTDRTEAFGSATASFFGLASAMTHRKAAEDWLYNMRSYWCEGVLFALMQQSYLETISADLARLGREPLGKPVDALFERWLAFRNVLWWRELSYTTDVPGRIVRNVHREMNTQLLFDDLEQAFTTYVDARRHRTADIERAALRSLQIYGAAFASVGAVAAVAQVWGESYLKSAADRLSAAGVLLALGVVTGFVTRALLRRSDRSAARA